MELLILALYTLFVNANCVHTNLHISGSRIDLDLASVTILVIRAYTFTGHSQDIFYEKTGIEVLTKFIDWTGCMEPFDWQAFNRLTWTLF